METKFRHKSRAITLEQMCQKMTCNNSKLDLAKMNAYIKFGEILPIGSQAIERKRNSGVNIARSEQNSHIPGGSHQRL